MRIIISDSSCLIDLRKASLLAVFLRLPFEILIPNTFFEHELLSFTEDEKKALLRGVVWSVRNSSDFDLTGLVGTVTRLHLEFVRLAQTKTDRLKTVCRR